MMRCVFLLVSVLICRAAALYDSRDDVVEVCAFAVQSLDL